MKLGLQDGLQVKVLLSLRPRIHMKVGQNQLHKLDMHGVICVPSAPHIHIIHTIHNKRKIVRYLIKVRIFCFSLCLLTQKPQFQQLSCSNL